MSYPVGLVYGLVYVALVYVALVYVALVYVALVYVALVYVALVYVALVSFGLRSACAFGKANFLLIVMISYGNCYPLHRRKMQNSGNFTYYVKNQCLL